jgi:hypothetical protein
MFLLTFQSSTGGSQSAFVIPPLAKLTRYSSESSEASSSPDVNSNKCTPLLNCKFLRDQPHPLEKAVYKENGQHMARSELARRERFVTELTIKIENSELQPLLQWTKSCLDNDACNRPELTDFFSVAKTCKFLILFFVPSSYNWY